MVLLFDDFAVRYCMENCKCPLTGQELLAYELEERITKLEISRISTSTDTPPYGFDRLDTNSSDDEDDFLTTFCVRGWDFNAAHH